MSLSNTSDVTPNFIYFRDLCVMWRNAVVYFAYSITLAKYRIRPCKPYEYIFQIRQTILIQVYEYKNANRINLKEIRFLQGHFSPSLFVTSRTVWSVHISRKLPRARRKTIFWHCIPRIVNLIDRISSVLLLMTPLMNKLFPNYFIKYTCSLHVHFARLFNNYNINYKVNIFNKIMYII